MKPKTGMYVVLPGGNRYKEPEPEEEPKPPEGFVDSTVYRYRLDKDGKKMLIGTMPPFPENAEKLSNFKIKKEDEEMRSKDGIDWTNLWDKAIEKAYEGLTNREIAEEMNVPVHALKCKFDREKRKGWVDPRTQAPTQEIEPGEATKPAPAEQEPATEIIAENKEQVKETDVPEDEVAYNFTKEDKPTQYKPMEAKDAEPPANAFEKKVDEQIQNLFKTGIPEEVNLLELYIDNITTAAKIRVMKVIKDPVAVEIMREMFERRVI
jgi:hypothetical protein